MAMIEYDGDISPGPDRQMQEIDRSPITEE
jgi:hypothetical protein